MSTYLDELSANIPLNTERSWRSMAEEACAEVDSLRARLAATEADAKAAKEENERLNTAHIKFPAIQKSAELLQAENRFLRKCLDTEGKAGLATALESAKEREEGLTKALGDLLDEQNGVRLFTRKSKKEYLAAVEAARTAIVAARKAAQ
jgi:hypothetical protein